MEDQRPQVTIVDPNAPPVGTSDLLDQGRDGWRPSAYQKLLAALTAAIVALISGGVAEIRHVHHDRVLDRASVRALAVYASIDVGPSDPSHEMAEPDVVVSLANLGDDAIRLLALQVDGTAIPLPAKGVDVPHGASFTTPLSSGACTPDAGRARSHQVAAALMTDRGQRVRRTFVIDGEQLTQPNAIDRIRCHTGLPGEAFEVSLLSVTQRGTRVTFTMAADNASALALTMLRIEPLPGIVPVARGLPVDLAPVDLAPARTQNPSAPLRRLVVSLRVVDCTAFGQYLFALTDEEPGLSVVLRGELEDGRGRIPFLLGAADDYGSLLDALVAACPALASGSP